MVLLVVICKKRNISAKIHIDQTVVDKKEIKYRAAAPANRLYSYSGSGLPFSSYEQAFEGTPNKGTAFYLNGKFFINLEDVPNSFYLDLGSELVPPTVFVSFKSNGQPLEYTLQMTDGIPFRLLSYHPSRNAAADNFYAKQESLPVRSQEAILMASAHPGKHVESLRDFWGGRPAV